MPKEALELLEVHCGRTEDRVDRVPDTAFESIAFEPVLALEVSDGRFDRRAAFHPTPECFGRRPTATFIDLHGLRPGVIVAGPKGSGRVLLVL